MDYGLFMTLKPIKVMKEIMKMTRKMENGRIGIQMEWFGNKEVIKII